MNWTNQVKSEIAKPVYAGMSDAAIADALNALAVSTVGSVSTPQLLIWAAKWGVTAKIQTIANEPGDMQSAAISLLLCCQGGLPAVDLRDASISTMLDSFVAIGGFSAEAKADLEAMATESTPFWQSTLGRTFDFADVRRARQEK